MVPELVDTKSPFENDHKVIGSYCFSQRLVRSIAALADFDRTAVRLIDQIANEDTCVLTRRANQFCVLNTEFLKLHRDFL